MGTSKPTLRRRLRAWWDGETLGGSVSEAEFEASAERVTAGPANDDERLVAAWSVSRLEVVQMIFGEGFTGPGGEQGVIDLMRKVGLGVSSNVLEIGAGLGGGARAIAKHCGAYVTGLEFDPELVKEAGAQSRRLELDKKAVVEVFDPENFHPREGRYAAVLIRDVLHRIEDERGMFLPLGKALKSGGQVIVRDVMLSDAGDARPLERWHGAAPGTIQAPTIDAVSASLKSTGLEVRTADETTEAYCAALKSAWQDFLELIETSTPAADVAELIRIEAAAWNQRQDLLQSGAVKIGHIVAVHP